MSKGPASTLQRARHASISLLGKLLIVSVFLCSGCRTVEWRWLPEENNLLRHNKMFSPFPAEETPRSITVIKGSF
jgi:hypothetical protein